MKTQNQLYEEARKSIATLNEAFMDHVKDGMTRKELETLIKKRPDVYGKFENWLKVLP